MMKLGILPLLMVTLPAFALQQPYAGQQEREIKALSPRQVQQYLSGAGMGYARPAELNRYPGPMHVLDLAASLALTQEQRTRTQALMDALFASAKVDAEALGRTVRTAAALEGEYRLSHLETHRRMRALLTEEQVARYDRLRGYAADGAHHQGARH